MSLKHLLPVLVGVLIGSANAATSVIHNEELAVQSVKCLTAYEMLGSVETGDQFGTNILKSQAVFMSTMYLFTAPAEDEKALTEGLMLDYNLVRDMLAQGYQVSGKDEISLLLHQCEGWREEMVLHMSENQSAFNNATSFEEFRILFTGMPKPKNAYEIKSVSMREIEQFVENTMDIFLRSYEPVFDLIEDNL